jgi:succinyl-CoA synthetase beta subunit
VKAHAEAMLGKTLITVQTGPAGRTVKRLLVEEGCEIARELYLSCLVDRAASRVAFIASTEGGMDIEKVAHDTPEKIARLTIDPASGYAPFHARKIAAALKLTGDQIEQCDKLIGALYKAFVDTDMSLLEINPLIVTKAGKLLCLDAKINFDDNALFRHKQVAELRDIDEEDPAEVEASKYDLNYVKLDGEIGCMVNGAGLAMATMDIIKLYGMEPANFLDVGGGASKEKVAAACKIILRDANVKGILVNIFGGIMRCDIIAEGVVAAAKEMAIKVPLVVRLEGTNVELGKNILAKSGLKIVPADNLADAAKKITDAVKKAA